MVDWNIVIPIGVAVLTAGSAVWAALLGNRYIHILGVRAQHHDDFREVVLDPWIEFIDETMAHLRWRGIGRWPTLEFSEESPIGFKDWPPDGSRDAFPPQGPLWDKSKAHWPGLHALYKVLLSETEEIQGRVRTIFEMMESQLREQRVIWFPRSEEFRKNLEYGRWIDEAMEEHGQGHESSLVGEEPLDVWARWEYDQEGFPDLGLRQALIGFWPKLLAQHFDIAPKELAFSVQGAPDDAALTMGATRVARGGETGLRRIKSTFAGFVEDELLRKDLTEMIRDAESLHDRWRDLRESVQRAHYDQTLPRRCGFCPKEPIVARIYHLIFRPPWSW